MNRAGWHLEQRIAELRVDRLQARFALDAPEQGLVDLRLDGRELGGAALLALQVPSEMRDHFRAVECDVRGGDLLLVYASSGEWPVTVESLWKTAPSADSDVLATLDLVVSVHTERLEDCAATRAWQPRVRGGPLVVGDRRDGPDRRLCGPARAREVQARGGPTPSGFLVRLPGQGVSYAEMVYPADYRGSSVRRESPPLASELEHVLFSDRLEKGVILRAWVRTMFLARQRDAELAAAAYQCFVASDPPLGC